MGRLNGATSKNDCPDMRSGLGERSPNFVERGRERQTYSNGTF
jgi:hypothetical protein